MFAKTFQNKKLVCFDFDGLLADTEPLHYEAYLSTLKELGCPMDLDFSAYCKIAHSDNRDLFEQTVREKHQDFPLTWEELRALKTKKYRELLALGRTEAMEGAEDLITKLKELGIATCIVTNSERCDVETIAKHLPFLKEIGPWFTREDYAQPKPSPDGYLLAVEKHGLTPRDAIGFEDTKKGIKSLQNAGMDSILVNKEEADISSLKELIKVNV